MKDTFGREITYLRLSVTDKCNLRCRYCMPEEGVCRKQHDEMLTEEEMVTAIEAAASLGVTKLRITGGEPLVKKNILSICRRCAAVPGIREVCLTTNGILLPEMAVPLREAGVRRINLSLDTLCESKYADMTRLGSLAGALRGLDAALSAGFDKVKVNAVLIGGFNDGEIPALSELTRRYPVDVRFIELMPMVDGGFGPDSFLPCGIVLERLPQLVSIGGNGTARLYRLPGAKGNIGLISPLSDHFCGRCNRLRLTADGKLKPCLHSGAEYPVKGLDRAGIAEQFIRAVEAKPERHGGLSSAAPSPAGRAMNQIGG